MEDGGMDLRIEAYHDIEINRVTGSNWCTRGNPSRPENFELQVQVDPSHDSEFIERSSVQVTKLSWWYHIHMVHSIVT